MGFKTDLRTRLANVRLARLSMFSPFNRIIVRVFFQKLNTSDVLRDARAAVPCNRNADGFRYFF